VFSNGCVLYRDSIECPKSPCLWRQRRQYSRPRGYSIQKTFCIEHILLSHFTFTGMYIMPVAMKTTVLASMGHSSAAQATNLLTYRDITHTHTHTHTHTLTHTLSLSLSLSLSQTHTHTHTWRCRHELARAAVSVPQKNRIRSQKNVFCREHVRTRRS
jgi:hypothetical protein